jgi:outer membrane immunogenic protein
LLPDISADWGIAMKKIALGMLAFAAMTGSAVAADMAPRYTKAPVAAPVVAYNWSGCYLGGFVGGATPERSWRSTDLGSIGQGGTFPLYNGVGTNPWSYGHDSSFIGGGTAGCNWQGAGSPFVVGIEGEAGYLRLRGSGLEPNSLDVVGSSRTGDWYGVIAGRAGYAVDRALFYVKGGVAFYNSSASVIDTGNLVPGFTDTVTARGSKSQVTYAVGAGIEYAFASNWTVKGEYLYLGRGDSYNACGIDVNAVQNFCWRQDPTGIHTAKIGVNYYFNTPVVAKY